MGSRVSAGRLARAGAGANPVCAGDVFARATRPFILPAMADRPDLDLDERSRSIFRLIVDGFLDSGEPTGSRTISRRLDQSLSPATIRNVMSDLEHLGLIHAPHVSAGRLPTERGLRFFVDTLMEAGPLDPATREAIEAARRGSDEGEERLARASALLGSISRGAGLVLAAKSDAPLRHVEFVRLDPARALVILVHENGTVENRVVDLPPGVAASQLVEASNALNASLAGRTLPEARAAVARIVEQTRGQIDDLASDLVARGLAAWTDGAPGAPPQLVVRGRGNLLDGAGASEADMERLRLLFDDLETKDGIIRLLDLAEGGEGVRIFIGSETRLFSLSGSSLVVAPYLDAEQRVVGAVGVIGPQRLNYARVVPVVDYTARLFSGAG